MAGGRRRYCHPGSSNGHRQDNLRLPVLWGFTENQLKRYKPTIQPADPVLARVVWFPVVDAYRSYTCRGAVGGHVSLLWPHLRLREWLFSWHGYFIENHRDQRPKSDWGIESVKTESWVVAKASAVIFG